MSDLLDKQKTIAQRSAVFRSIGCATVHTRKGFTLVELIVGLMLATIVIAAAGSFLVFGSNFLSQTTEHSQQQADVTNVSSKITEELRLARSVEVVTSQELPTELSENQRIIYIGDEDGNVAHYGYFYLQNGSKDFAPVNYYSSEWYGNYRITLDYTTTVVKDQPKYFGLVISAYDLNNNLTNTSSTKSFQLVNSAVAYQPFVSRHINSEDTLFYLLITYWTAQTPVDPTETTKIEIDGDDTSRRELVVWEVPQTGYYRLECWGADGGQLSNSDAFGRGGYASGVVQLHAGTTIYLSAGGGGEVATTGSINIIPGGFNGGGSASQQSPGVSHARSSGGGASDVRVEGTSLNNRIVVAGGGGGDSTIDSSRGGGNGGGETGGAGSAANSGGTQTNGGTNDSSVQDFSVASFGSGSSATGYNKDFTGAGGGGGWYGGGSGHGAGGGSGYVLTSNSVKPAGYFVQYPNYYMSQVINVQYGDQAGAYVSKPSTGHGGYVRVKWISE